MARREDFSSRLGFILVSAGCAIGLGNVWKFPYICGKYGGAAFILIYLFFLVSLGLPILTCEFSIGRGSKQSIISAFNDLEPENTRWHNYKWFGLIGNYLLMMFYTMVGGWMLLYSYKTIKGDLSGIKPDAVVEQFNNMLDKPLLMIVWMVMAIILAFVICGLGLQAGVEKITKYMMILLIVLMIALAINSLSLNGSSSGIKFYLVPDFQKMVNNGIGNVVFAAMSQAFFTLGLGIGSMEIFGSYINKNKKLTGESINIILLDTFVALVAGLIVIPACFAYNVEPTSGPPLLFITLPNVFNNMAGGHFWGSCFFIFMSFAALSTIIAVFENIIAMNMELFNISRTKAVIINMILMSILSLPAVLGYNVLKEITPLGAGSTIMDLEDFVVSNNIVPLGSLVFVLFCAKKNGWGFNNFLAEANEGNGIGFSSKFENYLRYIVPLIIIVVYIGGYYDKFKEYSILVRIITMIIAIILLAGTFSLSKSKKIRNN